MAWHHIVEQSKIPEFGAEAIHDTANVVRVSKEVNSQINVFYSTKQEALAGQSVREWLKGQPWKEQFKFGKEVLEKSLKGELR
jgi:hypothetical protein